MILIKLIFHFQYKRRYFQKTDTFMAVPWKEPQRGSINNEVMATNYLFTWKLQNVGQEHENRITMYVFDELF